MEPKTIQPRQKKRRSHEEGVPDYMTNKEYCRHRQISPERLSFHRRRGLVAEDNRGIDWMKTDAQLLENQIKYQEKTTAKQVKEYYDAMKSKVEYYELRGQYIEASKVRTLLLNKFAMARRLFQGIGRRLAPELVGIDQMEIEDKLCDAIDEVLGVLTADDSFGGENDSTDA